MRKRSSSQLLVDQFQRKEIRSAVLTRGDFGAFHTLVLPSGDSQHCFCVYSLSPKAARKQAAKDLTVASS